MIRFVLWHFEGIAWFDINLTLRWSFRASFFFLSLTTLWISCLLILRTSCLFGFPPSLMPNIQLISNCQPTQKKILWLVGITIMFLICSCIDCPLAWNTHYKLEEKIIFSFPLIVFFLLSVRIKWNNVCESTL